MTQIERFYERLGAGLADTDQRVADLAMTNAPASLSQEKREKLINAVVQIHQRRRPTKRSTKADDYYRINKKIVGLAFSLAFLIGPIGALYGSIIGGIILILVSVFIFPFNPLVGIMLIWPLSIVVATVGASAHNHKMRKIADINYA